MYSPLVGIDVSKDFFSTVGIDFGGKESFSKTYSMDSKGFQELTKTIRCGIESVCSSIRQVYWYE